MTKGSIRCYDCDFPLCYRKQDGDLIYNQQHVYSEDAYSLLFACPDCGQFRKVKKEVQDEN